MANQSHTIEPSNSPSSEGGFISEAAERLHNLIEHHNILDGEFDKTKRAPDVQLSTIQESRTALEMAILRAQPQTVPEAALQLLIAACNIDVLTMPGPRANPEVLGEAIERMLHAAAELLAPMQGSHSLPVLNGTYYRCPGLYPFPKCEGFVV